MTLDSDVHPKKIDKGNRTNDVQLIVALKNLIKEAITDGQSNQIPAMVSQYETLFAAL